MGELIMGSASVDRHVGREAFASDQFGLQGSSEERRVPILRCAVDLALSPSSFETAAGDNAIRASGQTLR